MLSKKPILSNTSIPRIVNIKKINVAISGITEVSENIINDVLISSNNFVSRKLPK